MAEDLRQADLSHLSLKDMNSAQRAEMRRRMEVFMASFVKHRPPVAEPPKKVRKWVPGMKR